MVFSQFLDEPRNRDVRYEHPLGFLPSRTINERVARFRQINADNPRTHHDALEFPDGTVVLMTYLCEGQRATVLQLPAAPRVAEQAQKEARAHAGAVVTSGAG